jgi:ABC-type nitrate/sulfonate/bicarbonate transport system permease component
MRESLVASIKPMLSKAGPFLIVAALWEAVTLLHLADPAFFPSIESILAALYELMRERTIFVELGASLVTAGSGLALGILIGVPLGTAMALSSKPTASSDR